MRIKIGKYLAREKPKEYWRCRGAFWFINIVLIVIFLLCGTFVNEEYFRVSSLILLEYFIGDLVIYHKFEKDECC